MRGAMAARWIPVPKVASSILVAFKIKSGPNGIANLMLAGTVIGARQPDARGHRDRCPPT